MRRSRFVATLLLSTGSVALSGCGDGGPGAEQVTMFSSVEACVAANPNDAAACETAYQEALAEHLRIAPRFSNVAECEAALGEGACEVVQQTTQAQGGGIFNSVVPFMLGYMVSNAISDIGGGRRGYAYSRPLYADRDGFVYSGDQRVSRFEDGCVPGRNSAACQRAGGNRAVGYVGGATGSRNWSTTTTVPRTATSRQTAVAQSPSRSSGVFGRTGSRASSGGGS